MRWKLLPPATFHFTNSLCNVIINSCPSFIYMHTRLDHVQMWAASITRTRCLSHCFPKATRRLMCTDARRASGGASGGASGYTIVARGTTQIVLEQTTARTQGTSISSIDLIDLPPLRTDHIQVGDSTLCISNSGMYPGVPAGCSIWRSSYLLLEWLLANRSLVRGSRVLELGAVRTCARTYTPPHVSRAPVL